jgi:hypothetical protein
MKTSWTSDVKDDQLKAEIISAFKSSTVLRKRLIKMLDDKEEKKQRECMNSKSYEKNNWGFQMADSQGYMRALKEIINLIED